VASWWNKTYKKMWDREKAEIIPFIQAKFWHLLHEFMSEILSVNQNQLSMFMMRCKKRRLFWWTLQNE
jgi:hypothetical protein